MDKNREERKEGVRPSAKAHNAHPKGESKEDMVTISGAEYKDLLEDAGKHQEYYDKWLRVHADFENTRKRLEKEKAEFLRFANEDMILALLPIVDNLDRAITAMEASENDGSHLKGIVLIKDELHKLLENCGVEKVKSIGEKFNPDFHDAVMMIDSEEHPEGIVVEELQAGYTMHGRLIRPASVRVSKGK